ncbi:MAG: hypothetical protein D3923_00430 [Candidatus Electrothrix sp. AR3]|nr:hypothetical protein [Candidatus Electrothrix sp. AR3]
MFLSISNQISLRILIPGAMIFLVLLTFFFACIGSRRLILHRVEETQIILVKDRLNALQGILENRHTAAKPEEGMQQALSLYGAAPDLETLLLTDYTGKIIASTRYQDVGLQWHNSLPRSVTDILKKKIISVQISKDREWLDAYAAICQAGTLTLRQQMCGVLYYRQNLQYHKNIALGDMYSYFLNKLKPVEKATPTP